MRFHNIAYKNIKGNLNKYVMYYLSNLIVVMVFFIFSNFIYNPALNDISKLGTMGALTSRVMYLCEGVILVFTLFFTTYSITNFLKSREKEFGLLSMFGITKSQLRGYVMLENFIVALASIVTGLLLGILFSKLFLMAVAAIMDLNTPIVFSISYKSIAITFVSFMALFQGVCYMATFRIKNNNVIELLKGARVAKPIPVFSVFKAILAVLLIDGGYTMAVFSGSGIIMTMLPILILTVTGTYFLYTQFSVFFTLKLQQNKGLFYKGTNMVTLSQIIYKLKDNAKMLFVVSILGAVTLTASTSVYSIQKSLQGALKINFPHDVSFIEKGLESHKIIAPEAVEEILKSRSHDISFSTKAILIKGEFLGEVDKEAIKHNSLANTKDFYIISNSDYNTIAKNLGKKSFNLKVGEAVVHSYNFMGGKGVKLFSNNENLPLKVNNNTITLKLREEISGGIINADSVSTNTVVINDEGFNNLIRNISDEDKLVYYSYNIKQWLKSVDAIKEIRAAVPKAEEGNFTERVIDFAGLMKGMSLFLFIGTFIAIVFFIATGSLLYFKMFNEIQKDKQEFIALRKMGMAKDEVKKIISTQALIVFFAPYVIALTHTAFAIIALGNLLAGNLTVYFMTISGIYLVLQYSYFVFAKNMYFKQINNMGI